MTQPACPYDDSPLDPDGACVHCGRSHRGAVTDFDVGPASNLHAAP